MFARIDRLVTKEGFFFQAWDDRYCKGVWAALGNNESEIDVVRDLSSSGDLEMIPAMDYVFSADWLPYVTGRTLFEAMTNLEEFLASLPQEYLARSSPWNTLVCNAIDGMRDTKPNKLGELPKTLEEALAKHALDMARADAEE